MKKAFFGMGVGLLALAAGCGGGGSPAATAAPVAPTDLAIALSGSSGKLTWKDNSTDETGFEVERNIDDTGWGALAGVPTNAVGATVVDLDPETTYGFRVRAVNAAGGSGYTTASVTTAPLVQTAFTAAAPYAPNYAADLAASTPPVLRWPTTAITYYVERGTESRDLATVQNLVSRAAARWSTASGNVVTFSRIDDSAAANILFVFVDPNDPDVNGGESGKATFNYTATTPRPTLIGATVKLKSGIPTSQLVPLTAHEIGHALGINGHSTDPSDTMYPTVTAKALLTARDANTLAKIYLTND